MDENYANLPTSHLLGSVPAVISEDKKTTSSSYDASVANLQVFAPNSAGAERGYETLRSPIEELEQTSANNWKGVFSIASYTQYFNVDTDIVVNRLMSCMYSMNGDFFNKIDSNPDLYGLVWISTTLIFAIASLGNCSTYLMDKRSDSSTSWSFDVSYVNVAACAIYGYVIIVPLAFYLLFQYLGSKPSLVRFWCMWGYSLFVFVLSSLPLVIPFEFIRWTIIIITGAASASFVAVNLRSYVEGNDVTVLLVAAFVLQLGLAIFIKMWFFA